MTKLTDTSDRATISLVKSVEEFPFIFSACCFELRRAETLSAGRSLLILYRSQQHHTQRRTLTSLHFNFEDALHRRKPCDAHHTEHCTQNTSAWFTTSEFPFPSVTTEQQVWQWDRRASVPCSSSLRTQPLSLMRFIMIGRHSHGMKATDGSLGWSFTTHSRNEALEAERKFQLKLCTHPRKHASGFVHVCIMYSEAALKIQQHNKEKDGIHRSHVASCSKFSLFPSCSRNCQVWGVEVLKCVSSV